MKLIKAMKHFIIFVLLSLILIASSCAPRHSLQSYHTSALSHRIDEILSDTLLQKATVGLRILSVSSGEVLYEKNSAKYYPPASNMKLLTTAGALFILKPEFRFKTLILTKGSLSGDTLHGDILIAGKGDPSLTTEMLSEIAHRIRAGGITHITGNILFDDTYFDTIPYGKGWMWDDLQYGFSAPINALSVNRNTCIISVKPGDKQGDALDVAIQPHTSSITIRNNGITGNAGELFIRLIFEEEKHIVIVAGSLPANAPVKRFTRAVIKPSLYASTLFKEKLEAAIKVTGQLKQAQADSSFDTLLVHYSAPLLKILYDLGKNSSNFIAEQTLKTIGAESEGIPGTAEKGIKAIAATLEQNRIVKGVLQQRDGSGLSRYNLITPNQITTMLYHLYYSFAYGPELLTTLPVSGIDGTLKN
ncbi:MAG: D-alanyl-D-alanine carboxypeptidase/D-alanyl-D-alanine-endopeptidase, partial [Candidatus Cloacimonadota bacterium]